MAVEWGLHSDSKPADLKRFLDEKFSYLDVLVPVAEAVEVEEVVGDELADAEATLEMEKPYVEPEDAQVIDAVDPELAKVL